MIRITIQPPRPQAWGSVVEQERRNRILLSVYAYTYEFLSESIVTDSEFDQLALRIRPEVSTGNDQLDNFFRTRFSPDTGQWVHEHPDLPGLDRIVRKHYLQRLGCAKIARKIVIAPPAPRDNGGAPKLCAPPAPSIRIVYPTNGSGPGRSP